MGTCRANTPSQAGYVAHYKLLVSGVHAIWPKAQVILVVSGSAAICYYTRLMPPADSCWRIWSKRQHIRTESHIPFTDQGSRSIF